MTKVLPWIVFVLFGFFLVGNNFSAKLGMIDDHEIAMFLGNDGKVKLTEIPQTILQMTEVGKWGSYLRYRPSYYTLRVIETSLWGDNATLWYLSRYVMLVISMYLGWKIISKYFPEVVSYLFVFYVMTMPFWPDLLTRLGPSEIYTIPALLLFVYGLLTDRLWMIFVGYIVCVGGKENFLFLFPFVLLWAGYKIYTKKFTKKTLLALLAMVGYTGLIVSAIIVATAKAGTDVYGTQISYRYRVTKFFLDIPTIIKSRYMIPALLVMGVAPFTKSKPWKHLLLMLSIIFVIFTQYVFYINQLPTNSRYDFPVMLLFPIFDLVAIKLVLQLLSKKRSYPVAKILIYGLIGIGCSAYVFHRGFTLIHIASAKVVVSSSEFHQQIETVTNILKDNPSVTVDFVSERSGDFEPIVSVERYLTARSITNTFSLDYAAVAKLTDPMELNDRLTAVMQGQVDKEHLFDRFSKFDAQIHPCYSITFGVASALPDCPEIARF